MNVLAQNNFEYSEKKDARLQLWVPTSFKQSVKDHVNKNNGLTIQEFIRRSLEYTMDFPQLPAELQEKVKLVCEKENICVGEFLEMSVEQALAELSENT